MNHPFLHHFHASGGRCTFGPRPVTPTHPRRHSSATVSPASSRLRTAGTHAHARRGREEGMAPSPHRSRLVVLLRVAAVVMMMMSRWTVTAFRLGIAKGRAGRSSRAICAFAVAAASSQSTDRPPIRLVASDVDGTLLDSKHQLAPRTVAAIRALQRKGVLFVPATGKSRPAVRNALGELGRELTSGVGGVFSQGLMVYKGEEVVYERTLEPAVSLDVLRFARERRISIIAFSGERILCEAMDPTIASVTTLHEPMPIVVPLEAHIEDPARHGVIHKLILMGDPAVITAVRPDLQAFVGGRATLTQAQGDMVEVLPQGASKGAGVAALLQALEVDPAHVLAIGDAENDIEMLKLAGTPVAMGNAPPHIQALAAHVAPTNDECGAAHAFETLIGL